MCVGFTLYDGSGTAVSERPSATGSLARVRPVTAVMGLFFFLASRPSPPSRPPVQDICEQTTLLPVLTASRPFLFVSFSSPFFLPFSSYLGIDDQHLAAAMRHQYALNTVLSLFSPFYLHFSCTSGATAMRIPFSFMTPLLSHHQPPHSS